MDIATVRGHAMSSPIDPPQERRFHGGTRTLRKRDAVLVVVETVDGTRGYAPAGASSSAMREFFDGATQAGFAEVIGTDVADALADRSFDTIAGAVEAVAATGLPGHVASQAASAIDVALHDIAGKRYGAPIYDLLLDPDAPGTTTFDPGPDADVEPRLRLPLYASAGMYMDPDGYAEQARLLDDLGFHGYKYRPGIGPDADMETVRAIREATDGIEIMVDAHTWWKLEAPYSAAERERVIDAYETADIYWLEEPVAPDDYEGYRAIDDATTLSIAGGESEPSTDGLRDQLATGAVGVLQGDVRHHSGFTGCADAARACRAADVRFVPHHFGTRLGLVANAHLVAALPDAHLLEYPVFEGDPALDHPDGDPGMYPFEAAFEILEDDLAIDDGALTVPDGPGLGVTVDERVIDRYPFREGAWTAFEYDDGA
jgi:L-alanine-DL-glutamate epimerase-like enolase superfamily enzyme